MTDKELKKLSREELLEMLLSQTRETERLKKELEKANAELEQRRLILENTGNIAEASLQLNGVFEAAQAAADQYLENMAAMEDETKKRCQMMKERTSAECDSLRREAEAEASQFWEEIRVKIRDPYRDHMWWQQILDVIGSHGNNTSGGNNEK